MMPSYCNNRRKNVVGSISMMLFIAVVCMMVPSSMGQFGVPKPTVDEGSGEVGIDSQGKQEYYSEGKEGFVSEEDAADLEAILTQASQDPETQELIVRMKNEMTEELDELRAYSKEEIVGALLRSMENMKLLELLFSKGPERALEEMIKDGMIEKTHAKKYKKNPELLEIDTRRGVYFEFVSLAVVGGYL